MNFKTNVYDTDITIFRCPNCGKVCKINCQCSCDNPVTYNIIEHRNGRGKIVVGYTDKNGNVRRFR